MPGRMPGASGRRTWALAAATRMAVRSRTTWGPAAARAFVLTLWIGILISTGTAVASESPRTAYSEYEKQTIEAVLVQHAWVLEPDPDGKTIEAIEVVPLPVFEARDKVPTWVNGLHIKTLAPVLRRELLFRVGDIYDQDRIDESARNLRQRPQLSVVLIFAAKARSDRSVRVVVVTKDVWSLRLNWDVQAQNASLTRLLLQPAEYNLFGLQKIGGGLFTLEPDVYSLGGFYEDPRILGTRLTGYASVHAIMNRETSRREGSWGMLRFEQPLYCLAARWGWATTASWRTDVERLFTGLEQRLFDGRPQGSRVGPCREGVSGCLPYEYDAEQLKGSYELVRSYGYAIKLNLSGGVEADRRHFSTARLRRFDPAAVAEFDADQVPVSDVRLSPFLQLRSFDTRFMHVVNYGTLGLQEDVRLGHEVLLRVYPASRDVGSSRDMLGSRWLASYVLPLGDGLAKGLVASTIEYAGPRTDALIEAGLRVATPSTALGRLVCDGIVAHRYRDYLKTHYELGGESRLRGYPSTAFIGRDLVAYNLELRSRPVQVVTAQLGGVLFYDVGDAFDGFSRMHLKDSVGAGLRVLFPQLDRIVFRIDWGFPLEPPISSLTAAEQGFHTFPGSAFLTFGQAFPSPGNPPETSTR
jgi:hypothetical protein